LPAVAIAAMLGSSVVSPGPQMKRGRSTMVVKSGPLAARTRCSACALVAQ
jgi:hypothetical protein